ncbi:uncharacterized protein [Acropora muricata]|uniref:uncharacterized protein n=1 Tax=Acropora muricata TaxID=159855 RepID=UPI0034E395B7
MASEDGAGRDVTEELTQIQLRPDDPTDLAFEISEENIPADFLKADVCIRSKRHLVFATSQQLQQLVKAKNWYVDGTFKLCRQPFSQLFAINAFVKSGDQAKQVPLLFVVMSGRKKRDYRAVLQEVLSILPPPPAVRRITLDFERALWTVLRQLLPDVSLQGCLFHWTQALWRKVQELGLEPAYRTDSPTYKYIRKLMALPFLPEAEITPMFQRLSDSATTTILRELVKYVSDTWVTSTENSPKKTVSPCAECVTLSLPRIKFKVFPAEVFVLKCHLTAGIPFGGMPLSLLHRFYRFSFRKLQIFISQTTDSHFANYRFSFRKLQISISQTTDFHFANYRFPFGFGFRPISFRKVQ